MTDSAGASAVAGDAFSDAHGRHTVSRRVYDMVVAHLQSGLIDFDDVLTEDNLAKDLDASRNAVREALRQLASEGILERERRIGTRVRGRFSLIPADDAAGAAFPEDHILMEVVDARIVPVTDMIRASLRLRPEVTHVRMVENLFRQGREIIGIRSAYYSVEYSSVEYPRLAGMREVMSHYFGRELGSVAAVIGSTGADARTARIMGIAPGTPMLHRRQTYLDVDDEPIQITFDHYRSDRVLFHADSR